LDQPLLILKSAFIVKYHLINKQFLGQNESPLFLQLDDKPEKLKDIPISIYESFMQIDGTNYSVEFVKTHYQIETNEAERIG
jgi:hypothetical protein